MSPLPLLAIQTAAFVLVAGTTVRLRSQEGAPLIRAILAGGLAAGACMHFVALIERGPLGSADQPVAFNLFWTSLAVLDPLAAVLLNSRSRAGIMLTVAIMVADVSINGIAFGHLGLLSSANWTLWMQVGFGVFALGGARRVWAAGATGGARRS